jgi:hypothetical protein
MGGPVERAAAILDRAQRATYKEDTDGNVQIGTYQDVEPHLDYAAKCRRIDAEDRGAFGNRGELRRTMAVPFNVILGIAQRLGIPPGQVFDKQYNKRIMKELKGPEFKAFRTTIDKRI